MSARDPSPSRFQWDDLRYFLEVARTQSLLDAAAKLGVSHSTVARRITALEATLSADLFEKKPSGYELSDTGKYLLDYAQNIETGCIQLQDAIAEARTGVRRTVRLSVPEGFGCHFLPRHLDTFLDENPDIDLAILAQPNSLSVSKREADISITLERPRVGRLVARVLTDYAMHCYASRAYLEGRPAIETTDDLKQHRLIVTQHPANSPETRFADTAGAQSSASLQEHQCTIRRRRGRARDQPYPLLHGRRAVQGARRRGEGSAHLLDLHARRRTRRAACENRVGLADRTRRKGATAHLGDMTPESGRKDGRRSLVRFRAPPASMSGIRRGAKFRIPPRPWIGRPGDCIA
jgi:DNA-binding transcriptional LysR family regulator